MISKEIKPTREILIQTNGVDIHIEKCELNNLEVCEICRRLIKKLGGDSI